MPILTVLCELGLIGFALYLLNTYLPMDGKIKNIMNVVVMVLVVIWLVFDVFGLGTLDLGTVPHFRSYHR